VTDANLAFLDWPGPIAFAHQGGAAEHPENSLAAFEAVVAMGYRYVETDVHVTRDGTVVVMHDPSLDRTTDRTGAIQELSAAEVTGARIGGSEPVPTLVDVLDALPDTRFNLDPKTDGVVDPLIDVIRRTGVIDRVCVTSFSDQRNRRIRGALGPRLCTGTGVAETTRLWVGAHVPLTPVARTLAPHGAACAQVPLDRRGVPLVSDRFVRFAHALGLVVHVWTIDDAAEMARLLDLGVDGIMTDRPSVLRDLLMSRGQWP
jgi:glycerophosphoryl diester phosphodiesterase